MISALSKLFGSDSTAPVNQQLSEKPVKTAQKAIAQSNSSSSSSSSSLSGKVSFHHNENNYLPASEKLNAEQKGLLMNLIDREGKWSNKTNLSNVRFGVEHAPGSWKYLIIAEGVIDKPILMQIFASGIGFEAVENIMKQAAKQ